MSVLVHFLIASAFALTVVVEHPEKGVISSNTLLLTEPSNVGVVSLAYFSDHSIEYDGSELGFRAIAGVEQRLDILSKSEMKAYGWCFSVDGVIPETLTHETVLTNDSTLRWFFAFAHYQAGVWLSQCEEE